MNDFGADVHIALTAPCGQTVAQGAVGAISGWAHAADEDVEVV
jgi:hypothetical protein